MSSADLEFLLLPLLKNIHFILETQQSYSIELKTTTNTKKNLFNYETKFFIFLFFTSTFSICSIQVMRLDDVFFFLRNAGSHFTTL